MTLTSNVPFLPTSPASTQTSSPTNLQSGPEDIKTFRDSPEGRKLVSWVQEEWQRAKQARNRKQLQWFTNMSMFYGMQWVEQTTGLMPKDFQSKLLQPKKPYYQNRKIINRSRAFVRWELAKFLSKQPSITAVPASSEDEDQRAAYAAEQAWTSISEARKLRAHYARAAWWQVVTGNGFVKTEWDPDSKDKTGTVVGDIKYSSVTPFHLFVPDLREQEIEDQPFIVTAYTRPVAWVESRFAEELNGYKLTASVSSANQIIDEAYLNLSVGREPDAVIVYEMWVKPGASRMLPEGGVIISVDNYLLRLYRGFPYRHGQYPITKFEHIPTSTFYADSPLNDLNNLQKEYNQLRSEIADAGKRMARPQLIAARGSIVPSKITNEPGLVIEYKPGLTPPQPMPLTQLPQYYLDQQDRVLADWEAISGERDVIQGSAPQGVTAGTAISYLQEAANQFLTPQYQSIELGHERIAVQTLELFVQYVDMPRKVRTIGADGSFDAILLEGKDIVNGTDVRVEPGSSMSKSKAAQEAKVMDMFATGIITDPNMALRLLEVGGVQKITDTLSTAEKKAQRENQKMKTLKPLDIQQAAAEYQQAVVVQLVNDPQGASMLQDPQIQQALANMPPTTVVKVDDFDVHDVHIEVHNRFRMGQEYELLPDEVKQQFELHVQQHETYVQQQMLVQQPIPPQPPTGGEQQPAGTQPPVDPQQPIPPAGPDGVPVDPAAVGGPSMSANGAVPAPDISTGGNG